MNYSQYIPHEGSAVFTLRLNIIIPQREDGTGNFNSDDPETEWIFKKAVGKVNDLYATFKDPKDNACYKGEDFIPSSFIQFKLNEIIYIKDDYFWNADNGSGCPNDKNWYMNELEKQIASDPRYVDAINVYFPVSEKALTALLNKTKLDEPKATPPCSELPTRKDLGRSSRICMAGSYTKYLWTRDVYINDPKLNKNNYPWDPVVKDWQWSARGHTLAHELGHSLGLNHGNEHHGRNRCESSIMNQLHNKPHNYLQPTELGKIHRNLRLTNIRNYLVEDVYNPHPIIIEDDEVLDIDYQGYEDIIVRSGKTLIVTCRLTLPAQARIRVEPGARLIIDGGSVSGRNMSDSWQGVTLEQQKSCFLKKKSKRLKGELILQNSGSIIGPKTESKKRG